jgi:actin-related protein
MKRTLNYQEEILSEIKDLPQEQISNLLKIIRIFKDSIMKQRKEDLELGKEFREWDKLSDEAFVNFEGKL